MPKYYTLLYINSDSSKSCYVANIVKISNNADIYDYLANVYLKYKETNDSGEFDVLCDRLDSMIEEMKYDEDDIYYENVYEWIKNGCSEDDWDMIHISKHKICIAK
ncbi:putative ORFan [Tupanvirus deep ocean]|uniref:ORFan n=2 Tax=Tupanvirus TaxID=2094720 RepID=A0AC62A9K8_9VIRU|nr:putative ORFan [Tupanvirus deep ocean]QKU34335.1 putative ORFan [Tupanvirus deep ocean]